VTLLAALALVCAANLPFGYWRAGLVRRSLPWLAAIHAPIPLVWLIRELLDLPWSVKHPPRLRHRLLPGPVARWADPPHRPCRGGGS
jgi:hypothetical protein